MQRSINASMRGFTLVELLVSILIFSVVMLIAVGSLLSMIDANRKAQTIKAVVNNLSFALDGMGREIRTGSTFHCGSSGALASPLDCGGSGGTLIAFEPYGGDPSNANDQMVYRLSSNKIERSVDGGATYAAITAPEVTISDLRFFVIGSSASDAVQPKIIMLLHGYAGTNEKTKTEIRFETSMTPRLLDE